MGFFQPLPHIPQYTSTLSTTLTTSNVSRHGDRSYLASSLCTFQSHFPTGLESALHDLARLSVDSKTLRNTVDADTHSPTLHSLTTFGEENRVDPLRTSEGWRALKDIGIVAGTVVYGYNTKNAQWNKQTQEWTMDDRTERRK